MQTVDHKPTGRFPVHNTSRKDDFLTLLGQQSDELLLFEQYNSDRDGFVGGDGLPANRNIHSIGLNHVGTSAYAVSSKDPSQENIPFSKEHHDLEANILSRHTSSSLNNRHRFSLEVRLAVVERVFF